MLVHCRHLCTPHYPYLPSDSWHDTKTKIHSETLSRIWNNNFPQTFQINYGILKHNCEVRALSSTCHKRLCRFLWRGFQTLLRGFWKEFQGEVSIPAISSENLIWSRWDVFERNSVFKLSDLSSFDAGKKKGMLILIFLEPLSFSEFTGQFCNILEQSVSYSRFRFEAGAAFPYEENFILILS